jgi:putative SOS response-associated peptidase YedK
MCGRYSLHAHPDVIKLQFRLSALPALQPRYNIAPAAEVLIVRSEGASLARWQLGGKYHNLRADTVTHKPFWREAYRNRRCLIPASGFYEWQQRGAGKQPYYARPAQGELLAMAGLWEGGTCAVITTDANAAMRAVHDRMPALLAREEYARWLAGEADLLRAAPEDALVIHPVGDAVNRAALDTPALIEPLPSGLQPPGVTGELFGA